MKNYLPKLSVLALSFVLAVGFFLFLERAGCEVFAASSADCARVRVCERRYNCWRETQCQDIYSCQDRYSCRVEYSCQRWYSCRNQQVCGWRTQQVCTGWLWWRRCTERRSYSCSTRQVCGWQESCGPERVCGWSRDCGWTRSCAPRNVCAWQETCEIILQCAPDPETVYPTVVPYFVYTPGSGGSNATQQPTANSAGGNNGGNGGNGSGSNPPAATPIPPTATPVPPTATPVPPTPTPVPALDADLDADYSSLVLYASKVGEPPQGMRGEVSGGDGGTYTVILHVRDPQGSESTYNLTTNDTFDFDSNDAGDPDFGTTEEGTWTAWIEASDSVGTTATSASATWEVGWYPSHETP